MVVSGELPRLCQRSPHLGWQIQVLDAQGSDVLLHKAFASAIASHSNGIILGGFEASELTEEVAAAQRAHRAGGLACRVSAWRGAGSVFQCQYRPAEVARRAANHVIQQSAGKAGVVIFNDERFDIANSKTRYMQELIEHCSDCKLLPSRTFQSTRPTSAWKPRYGS
jgi:ribose transport system substrate-binding protein